MILYKYFPCDRNTFVSLSVNGLWCSSHAKMNDPFECLASLNRTFTNDELLNFKEILSKSNIPQHKLLLSLNNEELTNTINSFRSKPIDLYAFCSFSEDPNNILMWSHYANNHSGVVIGFEFPELENNYHLQKVNYQDELSALNLEAFANFMIAKDDGFIKSILADYSSKSQHWSYEKEWRLWRGKEGYFKYKPENIKEVQFGLKTSIETKAILIRLLNFLPDDFLYNDKKMTYQPLGLK